MAQPGKCPKCGKEEFWDNRDRKRSGQNKPNAPDFKCGACEWLVGGFAKSGRYANAPRGDDTSSQPEESGHNTSSDQTPTKKAAPAYDGNGAARGNLRHCVALITSECVERGMFKDPDDAIMWWEAKCRSLEAKEASFI